jgi:hypothetical protein
MRTARSADGSNIKIAGYIPNAIKIRGFSFISLFASRMLVHYTYLV